MKKIILDNLLSVFVFLAGGIFFYLCENLSSFEFENKISFSDIINLTITGIIGIYLGTKIQSQHSSNRFEREYLILEIKKIISFLSDNDFFKNFGTIDFNNAKSEFKELNLLLTNFENTIAESSCKNKPTIKTVRIMFSEFRKSILNLSPSPNSSILNPTHTQVSNINKNYKNFRKELFKEIIEVNE